MNGANKLEEADTRPLNLCPPCLKKFGIYMNICDLKAWEKGLMKAYLKLDHETFGKEIEQI